MEGQELFFAIAFGTVFGIIFGAYAVIMRTKLNEEEERRYNEFKNRRSKRV